MSLCLSVTPKKMVRKAGQKKKRSGRRIREAVA